MQQKWNQNFDGEPMTDIPQKFLNAGCDVYMVMQLRQEQIRAFPKKNCVYAFVFPFLLLDNVDNVYFLF